MGPRSTVVLLVPAVLLVAAAAYRPPVDPPPSSTLPVTWTPMRVESVQVDLGVGPHFRHVAFGSDGTGLASAGNGRLYLTQDGGHEWRAIPGPATFNTSLVLNEDGVVLATVGNGRIFRSTDRDFSSQLALGQTLRAEAPHGFGANWTVVRPPAPQRLIQDLEIVAGATVFAAGNRTLLVSTDAGVTWRDVEVPAHDWYGVAFPSPSVGYVVGGIGQLLRTTDGGQTWNRSPRLTDALLHGVAALDERRAVVVGTGGTILRTEDGGDVWQPIPSGTTQHLRSIAFRDSDHGVAVGHYGTVLTTADGGRSWALENAGTQAHLVQVAFAPDGAAFAVGMLGMIVRKEIGGRLEERTP